MTDLPSGARLKYVMRAVATPITVEAMPKDKARISLVETGANVNYDWNRGPSM
jgi:hypothetical protein